MAETRNFGGWPAVLGKKWNESKFEWMSLVSKMRSLGYQINFPYKQNTAGLHSVSLIIKKNFFI